MTAASSTIPIGISEFDRLVPCWETGIRDHRVRSPVRATLKPRSPRIVTACSSEEAMQISERQAKTILSPQTGGFLVNGEFPFTHALSPYTGCAFGNTTCGLYCYAPFLPSWQYRPANMKTFAWGEAVEVKENAR